MSVSRRRFLELGTLAVAATALPTKASVGAGSRKSDVIEAPIQTQSEIVSLNYMNKDMFAGLINSTFVVRDPSGRTVSLKLISVEKMGETQSGSAPILRVPNPAKQIKRTDSFVLRFRSQSGKSLAQGTYSFSHVTLGNFALFVVPAGGSQPYCSAVFSRI